MDSSLKMFFRKFNGMTQLSQTDYESPQTSMDTLGPGLLSRESWFYMTYFKV